MDQTFPDNAGQRSMNEAELRRSSFHSILTRWQISTPSNFTRTTQNGVEHCHTSFHIASREAVSVQTSLKRCERGGAGYRRRAEARRGQEPARAALSAFGGSKGGTVRAASLSAKKRTEIARKAANKRWE
jgi:hypothetical protein